VRDGDTEAFVQPLAEIHTVIEAERCQYSIRIEHNTKRYSLGHSTAGAVWVIEVRNIHRLDLVGVGDLCHCGQRLLTERERDRERERGELSRRESGLVQEKDR
jgi:hypothetical protein